MAIYSLPASTSLLDEVNKLAPGRRKTQDGTVGDLAHQERASDHNLDESGNTGSSSDPDGTNEVHARDVDSRGPWPAKWSMERIVQTVLARCRSGAEKRLKYIIFAGRIWEASNSWRQRTYTGADQHREHAHFSFRYGSGSGTSNPENVTAPWGFLAAYRAELEDDMPTAAEIAKAVWDHQLLNPYSNANQPAGTILRYVPSRSPHDVTQAHLGQLTAAFNAFVAAEATDDAARAAAQQEMRAALEATAPAVAALVVAALPEDRDDITAAELQTAFVGALRELAAPQP